MQIIEAIFGTGRSPEAAAGRAVQGEAEGEFLGVFETGLTEAAVRPEIDLAGRTAPPDAPAAAESAIPFAEGRSLRTLGEASFNATLDMAPARSIAGSPPETAAPPRPRMMLVPPPPAAPDAPQDSRFSRAEVPDAAAASVAPPPGATSKASREMEADPSAVLPPILPGTAPRGETIASGVEPAKRAVDVPHSAPPDVPREAAVTASARIVERDVPRPPPEVAAEVQAVGRAPGDAQLRQAAPFAPTGQDEAVQAPNRPAAASEMLRAPSTAPDTPPITFAPLTDGTAPLETGLMPETAPVPDDLFPTLARDAGQPSDTFATSAPARSMSPSPADADLPGQRRPPATPTADAIAVPAPPAKGPAQDVPHPLEHPVLRLHSVPSGSAAPPAYGTATRPEAPSRPVPAPRGLAALAPASAPSRDADARALTPADMPPSYRISVEPTIAEAPETIPSQPATTPYAASARAIEVSVATPPALEMPDAADASHLSGSRPAEPAAEADVKGVSASHGADVRRAVLDQLLATVRTTAPGAVEIRLSPEELGQVRLDIKQVDGVLAVRIDADRPETLDLMRRGADVLARELRDAGFGALDLSFGSGSPQRGGHAAADGAVRPDREPHPDSPATPAPARLERGSGSARLDIRL